MVGIATDHCVNATARDAAAAGFDTSVLLDLTAAVTPANVPTLAEEWEDEGIWVSGTTENPETNENAVGLEGLTRPERAPRFP